jgi:hypothetical protein
MEVEKNVCQRLSDFRRDETWSPSLCVSLSESRRPGFVSTVRTDLPQTTHGLEEDTLGGILFLTRTQGV